jgi:hypothetical protein
MDALTIYVLLVVLVGGVWCAAALVELGLHAAFRCRSWWRRRQVQRMLREIEREQAVYQPASFAARLRRVK